MKGVFIILFIFSILSLDAQLYSYNNGGVVGWSTTDPDATTPVDCSCSPMERDDLIITAEIVVTLGTWDLGQGGNATITVRDGATLNFTGALDIQNGSGVTIQSGGWINVDAQIVSGGSPGGLLTIESGATMVVANDFTNNNSSDGVTINGTLIVGGNFTNGNGSDIVGSGSISVDGTVDNGGTIGGSTGNDLGVLPVELLHFQASIQHNHHVALSWSTASETNNDYFTIERSEDGENFYEIGRVTGNGTTNQVIDYIFTDKFPFSSIEYYRLKQTDYDGKFEHFDIARVETGLESQQESLSVYPTIVKDHRVTIKSNHPFQMQELIIYNLSGGKSINLKSQSIQENPLTYQVNTGQLQTGVYVLEATTSLGKKSSYRLIVK